MTTERCLATTHSRGQTIRCEIEAGHQPDDQHVAVLTGHMVGPEIVKAEIRWWERRMEVAS